MHAFNFCFEFVCKQRVFDPLILDPVIDQYVLNYIKDNDQYLNVTLSSITIAAKLISYFNKHKMALAGYVLSDWTQDFVILLNNYYSVISNAETLVNDETYDLREFSKTILLMDGNNYSINEINYFKKGCKKVDASFVKRTIEYLVKLEFGKLIEKKMEKIRYLKSFNKNLFF